MIWNIFKKKSDSNDIVELEEHRSPLSKREEPITEENKDVKVFQFENITLHSGSQCGEVGISGIVGPQGQVGVSGLSGYQGSCGTSANITHNEYINHLLENMEKTICYSDYISENLNKNISYVEYVAENLDKIMGDTYRTYRKIPHVDKNDLEKI